VSEIKQLSKKENKKFFKEIPKRDVEIVLVLENIMYATNVASLFRTSDAAGVKKIYLSGFSKQPPFGKDLQKTSRAKERILPWEYVKDIEKILRKLRNEGFPIVALEITSEAQPLSELKEIMTRSHKLCLIAGNETHGLSKKALQMADRAVFIPMYGKGASLNVGVSVAITLFSF
jgi:tRNA G18 (ribose-2'-O)-methylase SpoU